MAKILCFGEILWDFLPAGLFPGGAPFNVAYHLRRHGQEVTLLSGLGRDLLGEELLRRLRAWGLTTEGIVIHPGLSTGYVRASLGTGGDASYDITPSVAWDQILVNHEALQTAVTADALVFGSLAQRTPFNQAALDRVLAVLPAEAWRVFDVNLRPPHDDLSRVRQLAPRCTLLKLNAAEAARLADAPACPRAEEAHARRLAGDFGCPLICITAGAHGAGLLREGRWYWEHGRPVTVADTVGAGDAFLAALLSHLLVGESPANALARACRLGEWVAGQRGATPDYDHPPVD
jgi:fructokinase